MTSSSVKKIKIVFSDEKINRNFPLTKLTDKKDVIIYDMIYNKFNDITNDICGLLNYGGGELYIGVNNGGYCIGVITRKEVWQDIMHKFAKFMYSNIVNIRNTKFLYEIKIYEVIDNSRTSFMSKITVAPLDKNYFVSFQDNIEFYSRIDGKTVKDDMTEEQRKEMDELMELQSEFNGAKISKGSLYNGEECEELEFKLSFTSLLKSKDGIGKYIGGFGNSKGGKLVIGVNDKGIIEGVKIDNWDKIQRDILGQQYCINNVDFLKKIEIKRIPIDRKFYYLVEIYIPKNEDVILVKDGNGCWNKWVRVMSSCIKDDRQILFTQKQFSELEKKIALTEACKFKLERENTTLRKQLEVLQKKNMDVVIQMEDDMETMRKYCGNVLDNYRSSFECKKKDYYQMLYYIPMMIIGIYFIIYNF